LRIALAILIWLAPAPALAEWWVQVEGACVDQDAFVQRLRDDVNAEALTSGPRRTASVVIEEAHGRVVVLVADADGAMIGERILDAPGSPCADLMDAAVFVLATVIDTGASELQQTRRVFVASEGAVELTPPRPASDAVEAATGVVETTSAADHAENSNLSPPGDASHETPADSIERPMARAPRGARVGLDLLLGGQYRSGRLPGLGLAPRVSVALRLGAWAIRAGGAIQWGRRAVSAGLMRARTLDFTLDACFGREPIRRLRLEGCLGADLGRTSARGEDFQANRSANLSSAGLSAEFASVLDLPPFVLRAGARATAWAMRARATYTLGAEENVLYTQALATFSAFVELGFRIGG